VNLIGFHRERDLARTAELTEASEDESDHHLETQIGMKSKPGFAECQI
jgi:hypothetical protein